MKVASYLRSLAFVAIPLSWVAYLWERFTGVTFVLGRDLNRIGDISSPEHLHRTLSLAVLVTVVSIPIIMLTRPKPNDDVQ